MCRIAKELGGCPFNVEGAMKFGVWCENENLRLACGNSLNMKISGSEINSKVTLKSESPPLADGVLPAGKRRSNAK